MLTRDSALTASRSELRDRPSSAARSASLGSRSPARRVPETIMALIFSIASSVSATAALRTRTAYCAAALGPGYRHPRTSDVSRDYPTGAAQVRMVASCTSGIALPALRHPGRFCRLPLRGRPRLDAHTQHGQARGRHGAEDGVA